jgi:glycosyltransferase involved in cell wall biosynthesis
MTRVSRRLRLLSAWPQSVTMLFAINTGSGISFGAHGLADTHLQARELPVRPGILFLVNSLGIGGAERHVVSLLNNLDCDAYRLSLGYLKPDGALLSQLKAERLDAVTPLNVKRKLDFGVVNSLTDYINERHIRVIVSTNPYPTLYAMLAARKARTPPRQVEVFHSTVNQTLKEALQMTLYRAVFRRLDLLVYVSRLQREYWSARGMRARREVVIHNGVDTDYFTDRYTSTDKQALRAQFGFLASDYLIGICAALRPEKAHGDFLLALAQLRSSGQSAKGLIIGDGPQRAAIDRRIAQLGLTQHVAVTGFQADVRPFIAACDVMTLTSTHETLSLAALESMSMAKPVVLTRIGGAAELTDHGVNGFLFAPGDIAALTESLLTLASSELRGSMGSAGAASVRERFTKRAMLAAYSTELAALADSNRTGT